MRRLFAIPGILVALLATGCGSGGLTSTTYEAQAARRPALVGSYTGGLVNYAQSAYFRLEIASDGSATGIVDTGDSRPRYLAGGVDSQRRLLVSDSTLAVGGEFRGAVHPQDPSLYVTQGVHFIGAWAEDNYSGTVDAWHSSWPPALSSLSNHANWWGSFAVGLTGFSINSSSYDGNSYDYSSTDSSDSNSGSSGTGSSAGGSSTTADAPAVNDPPAGGGDPLTDDIVIRQH